MAPLPRASARTKALALSVVLFAGIAAHAAITQNDPAKIADIRKKALEVPLQTHVRISLYNGQFYAGRLAEVTDQGVYLLLRWDRNVERRDFAYEGIRSFGIDYGFKLSKRTLQSKLFEVEDGSLVELSLRSSPKITGIIEDYRDQAVVFRIRAGGGFSFREITIAEIKSFSVKSRARATVRSDPKVLDLIRRPVLPPAIREEITSQENPPAAMPVALRLLHTISTADAVAGDQVDFEILSEIAIGDRTVLARGGSAWGKVVDVVEKRRAGRGAEVTIDLQFARTPEGKVLPLRAFREAQRGGQAVGVVAGMAALGFVFVPLAPLGLLTHGSDTAIPRGTLLTAYLPLEAIPGRAKR